jgi:hypothetical protein
MNAALKFFVFCALLLVALSPAESAGTDAGGTSTSTVTFNVQPMAPPVIRLQPVEAKVAADFPVVFNVVATGPGTLRYQWRRNGVAVSGATAATYRIDSVQKSHEAAGADAGYDVVVTGDGGSVTSSRVALTVVEGGVPVLENPSGGSPKLGSSYTMRVSVLETEVTYQWRKNGVAITGATTANLSIPAYSESDAGRYDVVLRNAFGEVVSAPAYLGVASKAVPNLQKATYDWINLAGNGLSGFANGVGLAAQFNSPSSIAADGVGNLYVADTLNHVIRKVTQTGIVTTVAGSAGNPGSANGGALSAARFEMPEGIAVDKAGAVYIAESSNNTVRKLTNPGLSTASVTTVAGVAGQFGVAGGLNGPRKVAVDNDGKVYVLDFTSIRRVDGPEQFALLFGALAESQTVGQPALTALAVDGTGKLFAGVNEAGEFKVFSQLAGGTFASTNYGPYPFALSDIAVGAGTHLFAATDDSVQLLGDVSQTSPAAGLPVNLTAAVNNYAAPRGITVDANGTVFAVDPFQHTVLKGVPTGLPVFLLHPVGATGVAGVPLTLTAAAIGAGTVSYQWYRDGYAISGATGSSYTLASGGAEGGGYTVEASNAAGTVTSTLATVVGAAATLEILEQPQGATLVSGSLVQLRVGWRGPGSTTFQWYRNGVAVSGGTGAAYSLSAVRGSDAGEYRVQLKSGSVVLTSDTVKLTVNVPVSIFNQPEQSIAVGIGKALSLKVSATGTPPLTYQWYRNGVAISGGTSSAYNIPEIKGTNDAGIYVVEVGNLLGKVESEPSEVSILIPPSVVAQPQEVLTVNLNTGATFSVTAAGSGPLTYQWRRDGVPLSGGTAASLSLAGVREADAGVYDVLVSNSLGTVLSKPARLNVNLPPTIVSQPPASITAAIGTSVPLRVVVAGTGPFFYQWSRGNTPISGATEPTYMAPTLAAGTFQYAVAVTSAAFSTPVLSRTATLTVSAGRTISILREPSPKTNTIRGTAAVLKLNVEPAPEDALRTLYKLVNHPSGTDTGISGVVPAGGEIDLSLRGLVSSSGSYAVVLSREYSDGQVITGVKTAPFVVELRTLEDAAGTYEILLADSNGLVGDGATYRGVLLATVTKTGAVSGRVLYNEAPPLLNAAGGERAYSTVTRSFSASFLPSASSPDKLVCTPKLGVGTQANRQSLELELDFSATTVELNGLVRDRVSVPPEVDAEGCISQGYGAVRGLTRLSGVVVAGGSVDFGSAVGRYALGSEFGTMQQSGPGADNNATLLAQVLATGKVLWASRLSGATGTGSSTLSTTDQNALAAQVYQARTISSTTVLSTSSILGQLCFERETGGTLWSVGLATGAGANKLERQSCHITKENTSTNKGPVYRPELFDLGEVGTSSFNWSGRQDLEFQFGTSCRWTGSTTAGLLAFFNAANAVSSTTVPPLYLTAEDPVTGETYVWTITTSTAGTVRATNYLASAVQPVLTFRLDKTRGEWTGSFTSLSPSSSARLRCNLAGVVARPVGVGEDSLRGAGWVEVGTIPSTRTGAWRLELTPP